MTDRIAKLLKDFTKIELPFADACCIKSDYEEIIIQTNNMSWPLPEEQYLAAYIASVGVLMQNYYDSDDVILAGKKTENDKERFVRIQASVNEKVCHVIKEIWECLEQSSEELTAQEIRTARENVDVLVCEGSAEDLELSAGYKIIIDLHHVGQNCLKIYYQKNAIKKEYIQSFADNLNAVVESAILNYNCEISKVNYISDKELKKLEKFNDTTDELGRYKCLHELIRILAEKFSDRKAVIFEDEYLMYGELNEKSDVLARALAGIIRNKKQPVGIYTYRCLDMITSMVGVLKAGCAYVPIDPDYPKERIEYMIREAGISYVITAGNTNLDAGESVNVLSYDELMAMDGNLIEYETNPDDLAYIIFTSGSTGTPKGVLIEHRNVLNTLLWRRKYYDFTENDVVLQMPSFSFDSSVEDIFTALISGSTLVLVDNEMRFNVGYLEQKILQHKVTHAMFLPSFYAILLRIMGNRLSGLRHITLAGEAVNRTLVEEHFKVLPNVEVICECGPTETCVCANVYTFDKNSIRILLGPPIANVKCHVVNRNGMLSPIGGNGESWVESPGVGRGYLNNPQLTEQKFTDKKAHVLNQNNRMYKSGDIVKWTIDGSIEFVGRRDNQIKVRGFRVEPGEVEEKIIDTKLVENAVVCLNQDKKVLEAFVVMREDCTVRELRKVLSEKIPRYMIPSLYHEVLEIPTLPNGKIDRKRIQLVEKKENNCQTDLNSSEQDILNVIIGILKRPIISLDVLIEECGVSSLEAISLIYELEKRYKVKVVLAQLMKYTFGEIIDMVTHVRNQKKVRGLAEARRILEKQFQKKFCLAENKYKENNYFLYFEGKNEDKEEILKFIDMNFDEDFFPTKVVALEQFGDCIPTEEHVKHAIEKETIERLLDDLRKDIVRFHDYIVREKGSVDRYPLSGIQMGHIMMPNRYIGDVIVSTHTVLESRIEGVLKKIIECNTLLRSIPVYENGEWLWDVYPYRDELKIPHIDISDYSEEDQYHIMNQIFEKFYFVDFNAGYKKNEILPYKFIVAKMSQKKYALMAFMDHLVYDAMSYDILKKSMETLDCSEIKPLQYGYREYVEQTSRAEGKVSEEELCEVLQIDEYSKAITSFFAKVKAGQDKQNAHVVLEGKYNEDDKSVVFEKAVGFLTNFLCTLYDVKSLPFSFLHYGRMYNEKSYYEVFGEFVDFIPATIRRSYIEEDLQQFARHAKYLSEHELNISSVLFCRELRKKYKKFIRRYMPENEVFTPNLLKFNFVGFRDNGEQELLNKILDNSSIINIAQRNNGVVCEVFCIDESRFEMNLHISYKNQHDLLRVLGETGSQSDIRICEVKNAGIIDV